MPPGCLLGPLYDASYGGWVGDISSHGGVEIYFPICFMACETGGPTLLKKDHITKLQFSLNVFIYAGFSQKKSASVKCLEKVFKTQCII